MKVGVVGAGAIGGLIAGRIASHVAGLVPESQVSILARGASLEHLQRKGLAVYEADPQASDGFARTFDGPVNASDSAAVLGVQDILIISLKYNAMAAVVPKIAPMIGPETIIFSAMNGVPWWFAHGLSAAPAGMKLEAVDPDGVFSKVLPVEQVIGCVVHLAGSVRGPGVIQRNLGNRLVIGEPNGQMTERLRSVTELLERARFDVEPTDSIHAALWFKLWGNMTVNPVSAITGAWSDVILADPLLRGFLSDLMREAAQVGDKIGLPIHEDPESRHQVTAKLGAFKTSMLQDVEAGKPLELDALVAAVREIAQQVDVRTPHIDALLGLTRVFAKTRNLL
ncbi:MAG: 2-dehydropantoate 2-reductase [Burkholderiaceae bacterium]